MDGGNAADRGRVAKGIVTICIRHFSGHSFRVPFVLVFGHNGGEGDKR